MLSPFFNARANVARTGPYMHNGVFTTLKEVVAFYNRRDREPARFGPPEVPRNVNTRELGDLGLSERDEEDLVAGLSGGLVPGRVNGW